MSVRAVPLEREFAPPRGFRLRLLEGRSPRRFWSAAVASAVIWSLLYVGMGSRELVNAGGWPMVRSFFAAALSPQLDAGFLRITWDATLTTMSYAALGTALSVTIGLLFGVFVSQTWWRMDDTGAGSGRRVVRMGGWLAARGALGLPRGVHEVVWGLFLVNILGLDPLVGVLAIGIPFGAVSAKVLSELIDESPKEAFNSLRAAGVGKVRACIYGLGPQCFPDLMSYSFYRFECAIRAAAILGIIGAGGLGYQLTLSFSSLQYQQMWTLIYALILVSGLADLWSTMLRKRDPEHTRHLCPQEAPELRRDRLLIWSVVAYLAVVVVAAYHLEVRISTLWAERATNLLAQIGADVFPIDFGAVDLPRLWTLVLETISMSILAMAVSSAAAVAVAFFAAGGTGVEGSRRLPVALAARAILLFCRAVPPPVWALLLLFVLFPGPLPGALSLALYNFGILGRLMAEVVENLDPRPVRALKAQGAGGVRAFVYGVLPMTLPRFGGFSLYRWEVTMREVVVVGLVGAGGLGRLLSEQLSSFNYSGVMITLLTLVLMTYVADLMGASIRRALR